MSKNKINSSVHIVRISQAETFEGKAALLKEIFSAKSIFHNHNLIVAPDQLSCRIIASMDSLVPSNIPVIVLMSRIFPTSP